MWECSGVVWADVGWIARVIVAAVFAAAAYGKVTAPEATRRAVAEFGAPPSLVSVVMWGLPCVEAVLAIAVLPAMSAVWAVVAGLVLLAVFSGVVGWQVAWGRRVECACFGSASSAPVGGATLARNGGLAVVAGVALWGALAYPGLPGSLPPGHAVATTVVVVVGMVQVRQALLLRALRARLDQVASASAPGAQSDPALSARPAETQGLLRGDLRRSSALPAPMASLAPWRGC